MVKHLTVNQKMVVRIHRTLRPHAGAFIFPRPNLPSYNGSDAVIDASTLTASAGTVNFNGAALGADNYVDVDNVTLDGQGAEITLDRQGDGPAPAAEAVVTGAFERLLACAQGGGDGDAMFFAREIEVTGNTDVLVALRNALDGAEIDLAGELAALAGPLHRPVAGGMARASALYTHASAGLDAFKADVRAPLQARLDAQAEELADLRGEVQRLRRKQPRGDRGQASGTPARQEARS